MLSGEVQERELLLGVSVKPAVREKARMEMTCVCVCVCVCVRVCVCQHRYTSIYGVRWVCAGVGEQITA